MVQWNAGGYFNTEVEWRQGEVLIKKQSGIESSSRRLSALRLPHERQPRPQRRQPAAAACPGGPAYCTCHTKGSRGPRGGHTRRSSSRTPCVLRLPRDRQPRPAGIVEKKKAFKRTYCLYFKGEGSLQTTLLPLFQRRKGVFKRSYGLYFRGEGSLQATLLPLFQRRKGVFKRSYCLYFRGEGNLQTELPLFQRRRQP